MILREKSYYKPFSNVHFVEFDFLSIDSNVVALSWIKSTVQESWKVDRKKNGRSGLSLKKFLYLCTVKMATAPHLYFFRFIFLIFGAGLLREAYLLPKRYWFTGGYIVSDPYEVEDENKGYIQLSLEFPD